MLEWRERIAREKRRAYADENYWGRPVPYFGDFVAERLIVGLAPAAHGANRTGRMFTGDRSGDFLFAALHRAGVANRASSDHADDGLSLRGALIAATAHCAPPANRLLPEEIEACGTYLARLLAMSRWRSVLCLGGIAWTRVHRTLGVAAPSFGHGAVSRPPGAPTLVASYHPSQQNTFTGRLTPAMLDAAIARWLAE